MAKGTFGISAIACLEIGVAQRDEIIRIRGRELNRFLECCNCAARIVQTKARIAKAHKNGRIKRA